VQAKIQDFIGYARGEERAYLFDDGGTGDDLGAGCPGLGTGPHSDRHWRYLSVVSPA
jgi:hypothetical protein